MPEISPNGTAIVQVAAVSHQEDADVLISALKKRGYAVFIRQEPQDHLLHVQIGPFATKKDADLMRQRLLSDGYNAIVK
jgi:cell division septation protein DedD